MHAKGAGAHGTFTVTHDITRYTKAKIRCGLCGRPVSLVLGRRCACRPNTAARRSCCRSQLAIIRPGSGGVKERAMTYEAF
jgi:hypothetical protein